MTRLAAYLPGLALFVAGRASGLNREVASIEAVTGADGVQHVELDQHAKKGMTGTLVVVQ